MATATSPNTNTLEKQPHALDADFEDPHIVALRDNPEVREKLTWTVVLSVFVSWVLPYILALS